MKKKNYVHPNLTVRKITVRRMLATSGPSSYGAINGNTTESYENGSTDDWF